MTPFDDLTPEALHSYLTSTGWEEEPGGTTSRRSYTKGYAIVDVPQRTDFGDYGRRVREVLTTVAEIEGRPSPAEQVAASVRERAEDHDGYRPVCLMSPEDAGRAIAKRIREESE